MGVHNLVKHKAAPVTKGNRTVCVCVDRVEESGVCSVLFCLNKAV